MTDIQTHVRTHRQRLVLLVRALNRAKGHFLEWQATSGLCNYSQLRKRPKEKIQGLGQDQETQEVPSIPEMRLKPTISIY